MMKRTMVVAAMSGGACQLSATAFLSAAMYSGQQKFGTSSLRVSSLAPLCSAGAAVLDGGEEAVDDLLHRSKLAGLSLTAGLIDQSDVFGEGRDASQREISLAGEESSQAAVGHCNGQRIERLDRQRIGVRSRFMRLERHLPLTRCPSEREYG